MELSAQYTGASSMQTTPPETSIDSLLPADGPQVKPRIFPEGNFTGRSAITSYDQSVIPPRNTAERPKRNAGERYASTAQPQSREKRGAVLGACAKSEFRECRGGDALKDSSSSYVRFDQFERKKTRGEDGRGTCNGIVREAMRRIDRVIEGTRTDLPSAVTYMSSDMGSGSAQADRTGIYGRIQAFQDNPSSLGLLNYRDSSGMHWNPRGVSAREDRINSLMHSVGNSPGMPPGGLAYIGVRVQRADEAPKPNGHVLLVQRLPSNAHGDASSSSGRYAIFDPNNGVFTYEDWQHTEAALRGYLDSAYNEDGYTAVPDTVEFYVPGSGSRAQPFRPNPYPAPADTQLEPPELARHTYLGHDEL